MIKNIFSLLLISLFCFSAQLQAGDQQTKRIFIKGQVKGADHENLEYVSVYFKNTRYGAYSDTKGNYQFNAPHGHYILVAQMMGYETFEQEIHFKPGERKELAIQLKPEQLNLDEVVVVAKSPVQKVNESPFNVVAIDAKAFSNTTLDLANVMEKVSGVKLRESGGVGSDMQFSLNGFTGKHIKFFIDGVPMDGMGSSFQINNIPVNIAERIEIYKGVVPVGFGGDAIGGAVNIVTNQSRRTYVDISYSYGSFNTHRTNISAGYTSSKGLMFELNAYQNYSDNAYTIYNAVKDLEMGAINTDEVEKIKRFHDTYHNETVIAKIGLVKKRFADRLIFGINLGKNYKEIQNGVRQDIVYGEKHSKGHSIMPSFQYAKRNFFTDGLNVNLTANLNKNMTHNIDTATYEYNWRGEKKYKNGKVGEQSHQDSKYNSTNWNTTVNAHYRLNEMHSFTLNNVLTSFDRSTSARASESTSLATDTMPKVSRKNILGLDYKLNYRNIWNVSVFGKHYNQYSKGPKDVSTSGSATYELFSETFSALGYGIAATYFWREFQLKASYEKAYRLPTDSELFGDEDLEKGSGGLKAESSDNYNISISYNKIFNKTHFVYLDAGFMLRNTKDYIRRVTDSYSNVFWATHVNHGYVKNIGINAEAKYGYKNIAFLGMNVTSQNIKDNERYTVGNTESTTYKVRMPNIPYFFMNGDAEVNWNNFLKKNNHLTFSYNLNYVHEFSLYFENHGSTGKRVIPEQLSHDVRVSYAMNNGRYNVSLECRNITDERLYDSFSLQKPGRAFYAKVRYFFNK